MLVGVGKAFLDPVMPDGGLVPDQSPFRFAVLDKLVLQKTRDASRNLRAVGRWSKNPGHMQSAGAPGAWRVAAFARADCTALLVGPQPTIPAFVSLWPRRNVEFSFVGVARVFQNFTTH